MLPVPRLRWVKVGGGERSAAEVVPAEGGEASPRSFARFFALCPTRPATSDEVRRIDVRSTAADPRKTIVDSWSRPSICFDAVDWYCAGFDYKALHRRVTGDQSFLIFLVMSHESVVTGSHGLSVFW